MAIYKDPRELAQNLNKVPPFNKKAIVEYLKNYGSGFDDDAYEEWAKSKGKELKKSPLHPAFIGTPYHKQWYGEGHDYTYAPQYLEDEEWLQKVWPDIAEDATEYFGDLQRQKQNIDPTDDRSWGPEDEEDE